MTTQLTDLERWLAEIAVAAAPPFTEDQIAELRRALKPNSTVAPTLMTARRQAPRRAAA